MTRTSLRSSPVAFTVAAALWVAATPLCAQDRVSPPAHSMRAAIGRETVRLVEASVPRTAWQQSVRQDPAWVDRHFIAAGSLIGAAAGTTRLQEPVEPQRSWVGRHPVATGALIGAAGEATYGYVMPRRMRGTAATLHGALRWPRRRHRRWCRRHRRCSAPLNPHVTPAPDPRRGGSNGRRVQMEGAGLRSNRSRRTLQA